MVKSKFRLFLLGAFFVGWSFTDIISYDIDLNSLPLLLVSSMLV